MLRMTVVLVAVFAGSITSAMAQPGSSTLHPAIHPVIHPIFGSLGEDAPHDAEALALVRGVAARQGLPPVEIIDVPGPPPSRMVAQLEPARRLLERLRFDEALALLEPAMTEALATGGAGLDPTRLSDLFLYGAIAYERADWRESLPQPLPALPPKAWEAYRRAAAVLPERTLDPRLVPPRAQARFRAAAEAALALPRATLTVHGPRDADVVVDGRAAAPLPATIEGLVPGEHFVRIEPPGFEPFHTVVTLAPGPRDLPVPALPPRTLPDDVAARHARAQGARFALVTQVLPGPEASVWLRLVDATSATRQNALLLPWGDPGSVDAAVLRLRQEVATQAPTPATPAAAPLAAAPPAPPAPEQSWAKRNWPALVAAGAAVLLVTIVAGVALSGD